MAYRIIPGGQDVPHYKTGRNGDYYVSTNNWILFGPKTNGRWPPGKKIWPGNMTPRPALNLEDDQPLMANSGLILATDSGAVLFGDTPPPKAGA